MALQTIKRRTHLVLERRRGQRIFLVDSAGQKITVRVARCSDRRVRLFFDSPADVQIWREEIAPPHLTDVPPAAA